ncbi:hypothetical protein ACFPJ4_13815 [Lysinimonas soli]|uniref:Uncharacterized protein n=1 Tax=Lysinimonas soli TaxID=1074233 RepID=A0ABW0NTB3_9MICO
MIDKPWVQRARADAIQAWSDALGDSTACALAKSGRSYPSAKFHEGRVAALGEVLRGMPDGATQTWIAAAVAEVRGAWRLRRQPGADPEGEWASYRAGGLEALRELDDTGPSGE